MCGICGIFNFGKTNPVEEKQIRRMCKLIVHRGPDDEGIFVDKNIGLGMRRLAIIDLQTGHQPIFNEDKTLCIVLNGEIYNFQEIRNNLEKKGHKFYTKTDVETVVHLYEEYQEKCVEYLRGMFAFAIWDKNKERLFLARDRIGKKPLFYTIQNGSLIFASEMKSILEILETTPEIDFESIDLYLTYQYIPGPRTIFKSIKRLQPAHIITCNKNGNIKIERYWNLDFTKKTNLCFEDASQKIREILTESTKLRLISDVPLGAFLSGGHDSTIIVGLMSQIQSKPVKTFSIGFEDQDFSELKYAKIVAERFNTEHNEFIVKPHFIDILPKIIWHYDQPFADTSALPSYYVANITKKYVTVALNGDGGDENFAGYLRYKALKGSKFFSWPFQILGKNFTEKFSKLIPYTETSKPKSKFRYMYRLISALSEPPERRNVLWHCFFDNNTKYRIYSENMKSILIGKNAYEYLEQTFLNAPANDILDKAFYTDIMTYLPECLLVKMDIACMANSLEGRSPFLDHNLIEFTATLPSNWKMHFFTTKYILKETFKDLFPSEILNRGKQGFGIPVGKWFKEELKNYIKDILLEEPSLKRGYFDENQLKELIDEHITGKNDHGYKLWALLVLELWHRIFIDREIKIS